MSNSLLDNTSNNGSVAESTRGTVFIAVESCIFILLDFAAFVGNSLVCAAFYRNPSLGTVTNYFVLSLALTDLSMAVLVMPLSFVSSTANEWVGGDFGCKMRYFCWSILGAVSLLTVMLLAINRFVRVTRPVLYPRIYSKKRSIVTIGCTWVVSIVVVVVLFFVTGIQFRTSINQPTFCLWYFSDTSGSITVTVVRSLYISVCSLVVIVCYIKIYRVIRQHNISVAPSTQGGNSVLGVEEAKMTRILTAVVVGFYLCYMPVLVSNILSVSGVVADTNKYFNFYFTFPFFASSVINPVIYATMSQPWRKEFLELLRYKT